MKKLSSFTARKHFPLVAFVLAFAVVGTTLLVLSRAATAVNSVKSGLWSDPTVWSTGRVPEVGDTTTVETAHSVTYDVATSPVLAETHIKGTLTFDPNKSTKFVTQRNIIVTGKVVMKPSSAAVKQIIQLVNINEASFVGGGLSPIPTDVGLWVMDAGQLDIAGTPKTGWTRAAGAVAAGATSVALEGAPTGWAAGDEISIAPTEAPTSSTFSTGFDQRTLTNMSGATATLNSGTTRPHPMVNNKWKAEVMNLTRNVMIEGTPNGRSHIFIRSTRPQSIKNATVRYVGPRQAAGDDTDFVLGRYGIHIHHSMDGSRGSIVEGTVIRDAGSHAYVPHMSHGITFRDTVSYNTFEDAYWWDQQVSNRIPGDETHDTLYDHAIAAIVKGDPDFRAYRLTGFNLAQGHRNEVRNSAAVGVQGSEGASGFEWPESFGATSDSGQEGHGEWNFARGNVSHNNRDDGIFTWQNDSQPHVIANFDAYHNGSFGVQHGAYINAYHYEHLNLYGNSKGGVSHQSINDGPVQTAFMNSILDGAGLSDHLVLVYDHNQAADNLTGIRYENSTLRGAKKQAIHMGIEEEHNEAAGIDFINTTLNGAPLASFSHAEQILWDNGLPNANFVRVQNGSTAYRAANPVSNGVATRTTVAPFATTLVDRHPPQPSLDFPSGGNIVNGTVNVTGYAYDLSSVTRVELYVDGTLRGTDTTAPYGFSWNTAGLSGAHTVQLRGYDPLNNVGYSPLTTVFVGSDATPPPPPPPPAPNPNPTPTPDTTAPVTSVTAPANGAALSGSVNVTATATDNIGVTRVDFLVDNTTALADTSAPYAHSLVTTTLSNGQHTLRTRAYDAAGNSTTSATVTVTINNANPNPTPPPTPQPTFAAEDINQDGKVNLLDFSLLAAKFGQQGANLGRADINGDGRVNLLDFSRLAARFGR